VCTSHLGETVINYAIIIDKNKAKKVQSRQYIF